MDQESHVETFEELGMTDPFRTSKSLHETLAYV
jgi:hypothetical protein